MNVVDKGGPKLDEMNAKYVNSESKLHNLHNDYVIALQEANVYQEHFNSVLLPSMLEFQQKHQESLVLHWFVCCFMMIKGQRHLVKWARYRNVFPLL